jgi:tRNA(fMet)-specific endonuclease VapC
VVQFGLHYLLNTNTVRYVIKGSFPHVRERLAEVPIREVGTSVITEAELRFGVARLPRAAKLGTVVEEFLRRIEVMAWDSAAAQRHGRLRAVLEEQGDPMGNMDLMIAAHALAVGVILVSNDPVFRRVKGLRVEDWTKS